MSNDMHSATQEKFILEERQRQEAKERKMKMVDWVPNLFERDNITGEWVYKYIELVISSVHLVADSQNPVLEPL